jgi:hypothetical protein
MRLFEIIILAITLLSFLLRFLPLKKFTWIYLLPTLNLLAFGYHLFFEGTRWQMIPLYILVIAFIPMGFRKIIQPEHRFKWLVTILAAVLLLVGAALPALLPVPVFPDTQGPYAVGTTFYYWVDQNRLEAYSPDPDLVYADPPSEPRRVMVQVWYPATAGQVGEPAPYLPDGVIDTQALATSFDFPGFFLNHFQHATTNSLLNAPIATCFD